MNINEKILKEICDTKIYKYISVQKMTVPKIYKINFFVPKYLYLHDCTDIYYNDSKCIYRNVLF